MLQQFSRISYPNNLEKFEVNVLSNFKSFQQLVGKAQVNFDRSKFEIAAVYCQMAADYASHNHPGLFYSSQIEQILLGIGSQLKVNSCNVISSTNPRNILHVMTQAYRIGGHTRLVWRWIEMDANRTHSLVLTRQGVAKIPSLLIEAITKSGGNIYVLDKEQGSLIKRAEKLHDIAKTTDRIVLHIHPFDVLPDIAFAQKEYLPPVIYLNHADHLFWLGRKASNVVANIRTSGAQLSRQRRAVKREKSQTLPIPLTPTIREIQKVEAKRKLGFAEDTILLLSVASAYKYNPVTEDSFVNALVPVLEKNKNATLLVFGPENSGQWAEGYRFTEGRIRAMGRSKDLALYYQASDIYLDSFPFASLTSMLEAGSYGTPIVAFSPYPTDAQVLSADDPALHNLLIKTTTVNEYREAISSLILNAHTRDILGKTIEEAIFDNHSGKRWQEYLAYIYSLNDKGNVDYECPSELTIKDIDLFLEGIQSGVSADNTLDKIIEAHIRLLPFVTRLMVWSILTIKTRTFLPGLLLPEWLGVLIEQKVFRGTRERIFS